MAGEVARPQPPRDLIDQGGDVTCGGGPEGISAKAASHYHWPVSQAPGTSLRLRVADEEMEVEHGLREPLETTVVRQHGDPIHGLGVGGDDSLRLI